MSKKETPSFGEDRGAVLPTFSDKTHRVADLAVKIMGLVPRQARDPNLPTIGLDEAFWDAEFDAARRRAEILLDDIENNRGDIEAYQLFEEGSVLSCDEICKVFKDANWKGLSSKEPVTKLMNRVKSQFGLLQSETLHTLPSEAEALSEDVLNALDTIAGWDGVRKVFPGFLKDLNCFIASLRRNNYWCPKEEIFGDLIWLEAFSNWCFPTEGSWKKKINHYRAHEIFRFAASKKWEGPSLIKPHSELQCFPQPKIHPRRLDDFEKFSERESILTGVELPKDEEGADG